MLHEVVDVPGRRRCAFSAPASEELPLEFRNLLREGTVVERCVRVTRIIKPHEVMPMAGEAITLRALIADGILLDDAEPFADLIKRCADLEKQANAKGKEA